MNQILNPKELTRYWHALTAFQQAKSISDLMVFLKLHDGDKRSAILFGALCGYYARPFGPNHGIGKLSPDIVPAPFSKLHDDMMYMRDKVFLHSDSDAKMSDNNRINELKFVVAEDGRSLTVENKVFIPTKKTFGHIQKLLDVLILGTNHKIKEYIEKIDPGHPFEAGATYDLEICENKITLKKTVTALSKV